MLTALPVEESHPTAGVLRLIPVPPVLLVLEVELLELDDELELDEELELLDDEELAPQSTTSIPPSPHCPSQVSAPIHDWLFSHPQPTV